MTVMSWIIVIGALGFAATIGWLIGVMIYEVQEIKKMKKQLAEHKEKEANKNKLF